MTGTKKKEQISEEIDIDPRLLLHLVAVKPNLLKAV